MTSANVRCGATISTARAEERPVKSERSGEAMSGTFFQEFTCERSWSEPGPWIETLARPAGYKRPSAVARCPSEGKDGIWVLEQLAGKSATHVIVLTAGVDAQQV